MNAEFTAKLMAQNVDLEALVQIQADRIAELEKGLELVKDAYCARDSECKQLKGRIAELEKAISNYRTACDMQEQVIKKLELQTKPLSDDHEIKLGEWQEKYQPLSDEEIEELWTVKHPNVMSLNKDLLEFGRAIEAKVRGQ